MQKDIRVVREDFCVSAVGKLGKLEGQSKATFAALFGLRAGGGVDLSAAYRYNQNMMEYYTCKSISFYV